MTGFVFCFHPYACNAGHRTRTFIVWTLKFGVSSHDRALNTQTPFCTGFATAFLPLSPSPSYLKRAGEREYESLNRNPGNVFVRPQRKQRANRPVRPGSSAAVHRIDRVGVEERSRKGKGKKQNPTVQQQRQQQPKQNNQAHCNGSPTTRVRNSTTPQRSYSKAKVFSMTGEKD